MRHLSERERRCVEFLAQRYKTTKRLPNYVKVSEIPKEGDETHVDLKHLVQKLKDHGLVEWSTNESFVIQTTLLDIAHEAAHPPPRNYWKELSDLWQGNRWFVAITVIVFVAPIIAQWIQWIIAVYQAFTTTAE